MNSTSISGCINDSIKSHPTLPHIFRVPLRIIPKPVRLHAITRALNTLFGEALKEGQLDFLEHKRINITIKDTDLAFSLSRHDACLLASQPREKPDLAISGNTYAFLLLGTRKEDADTLFFRRQITSEGDTELGLFVKNFLDGLEPETLPAHKTLNYLMCRALRIANQFSGRV